MLKLYSLRASSYKIANWDKCIPEKSRMVQNQNYEAEVCDQNTV